MSLYFSAKKKYDAFSTGSIVIIAAILTVFNFEFRTPLISGFVAAVLTYPLYCWTARQLSVLVSKIFPKFKIDFHPFSALFIVILLSLLSLFSLAFVSLQLTSEVPNSLQAVSGFVRGLSENQSVVSFATAFGYDGEDIARSADELEKSFTFGFLNIQNWISFDNLTRVFNLGQQVLSVLLNQIIFFIIFLIAWYNGLIFGSRWVNLILSLFPFKPEDIHSIKHNLTLGIRNVIYANLVSGTINFIAVLSITMIFGLPNSFVLAALAFAIGFLPITPSETAYAIPILLIFQTNPLIAILIAVLAELFILWQNYVFLPKIVLTGTGGNPLFIITGVFTGIAIFGVMGFIIGPAIMIFVNTLGQILLLRLGIVQKEKPESV